MNKEDSNIQIHSFMLGVRIYDRTSVGASFLTETLEPALVICEPSC